MADMPRGRQLETFVASTNYDTIPEEVREAARQALVDYIGVSIAGQNSAAAAPQSSARWFESGVQN